MSPVDQLDAEALRIALGDPHIVVLEETTSTNDVAFRIAEGARQAIVFAERQTAGRGQHGNRWESSSAQGLWFSFLVEERIVPNESWRITQWAAESVAATINEQFSLGAKVKPPNDVYVGSRKLAGVLLELRAVPHAEHAAILGIGINVNHAAEDFPAQLRERAVSLAMLTGNHTDRQALAIALLRRLRRGHPREPFAIHQR